MGLIEDKPDDQKVEDEAEHGEDGAIGVNNDHQKGEDCWSNNQGNSNGHHPHGLLRLVALKVGWVQNTGFPHSKYGICRIHFIGTLG